MSSRVSIPASPNSSLASTLARVSARDEVVRARVGRPSSGRWISPADLVDPAASHLDGLISQAAEYLVAERRVAAALFFHMYVWAVSAGAICAYVTERRVPEIAADNVLVEFDGRGMGRGIALLAPRFAALRGDLARGDPDVTLVGRAVDLTGWLCKNLIDGNLEPVAGAIRERKLLGWPILWGIAADTCASAFVHAGHMLPDGRCALDVGNAFFAHSGSLLGGRTTLLTREHAGRRRNYIRRAACCLGYKTAVFGYCETCPLLGDEEIERRLTASLEQN
jgi:ferric iron reductase protein FhuF